MFRLRPAGAAGAHVIVLVALGGGCFDLDYAVGEGSGGAATTGLTTADASVGSQGGAAIQGSGGGGGSSSTDVASSTASASGSASSGSSSSTSSSTASSASSSADTSSTSVGSGGSGGEGTGGDGTGGDTTGTGGSGGASCDDTSVLARLPARHALDVDPTTAVEIQLACPIDQVKVDEDSFLVVGSTSGPHGGELSFPGDARIRLVPDAPFTAGEMVTVTLTADVTTASGAPLGTSWSFFVATTAPAPRRIVDSHQLLGTEASQAVALGDLDGDGDLDGYAANVGPDRVWLNDGTGLLATTGQDIGTNAASDVALGDLDGDGDLDAYVTRGSLVDRVYRNDGSGFFTDSGGSPGEGASTAVALGDLDADGDLDALVADGASPSRAWFNDGTGIFDRSAQGLGQGSDGTTDVALGDLDHDGDLDAVLANPTATMRVFLNDGAGVFVTGTTLGSGYQGVALGDVTGDGNLDVVAGYASGFTVFNGGGNGAFGNVGSYPVPGTMALGDLDGDGDLDAVSSLGGVALNVGAGVFVADVDLDASEVALGDLDDDGDLDLFTSSDDTDRVFFTIPEAASCAAIHADAPAIRSGRQTLGSAPEAYAAYCDMEANGGGWTLLFNQGPSFDRNTTGDPSSDCHDQACVSRAYAALALGPDLRIDASDAAITGDAWVVRTTILGVDPQLAGAPLRTRLVDTATRYWVEADDNAGVTNEINGFTCATLPYVDYAPIICSDAYVIAVNDVAPCNPSPPLAFGREFTRGASSSPNCAGWPNDPNFDGNNYWPDVLRIWTR